MAKIKSRTIEEESSEHHLYRITFRRRPEEGVLTVKTRTFMTIGVSEIDAVKRVVAAYSGSSFGREFDVDNPTVEFIIGGLLKTGGN